VARREDEPPAADRERQFGRRSPVPA